MRLRRRLRLITTTVTAIAGVAALTAAMSAPAAAASRASVTAAQFDSPLEMTPELQDKIQTKIEELQAETSTHAAIAGLSVAVVTPAADGTTPVVTQFAVGTPTLGSDQRVDATTQFEIASQSKVFTADLLAYLVAQGRISLDDKVKDFAPADITVPSWTDADTGEKTDITIRDLATMEAGLPDSPPNYLAACDDIVNPIDHEDCESNQLPWYTPALQWQAFEDQKLLWAPGSAWRYSNFGYGLLGVIVAGVVQSTPADQPPAYLSAIQGAFLDDLGMDSTALGTGPRIATPYTARNELAGYLDDTNAGAGEGGLVSDAKDMATWVEAHLGYLSGGAPLGVQTMADTLQQIGTVTWQCDGDTTDTCHLPNLQTGMAWQLYAAGTTDDIPVDWAFKNGGSGGFSSDTALVPSEGVGVTAMWNQERGQEDGGFEVAIPLLTLITNYHDGHGGDHGDHGNGTLPATGLDGSSLALAGGSAVMLVAAGAVLLVRARRHRSTGR